MATILLDNLSALFKRLKAWKALHKSVQWNTNCWKATNKTAGISKQDFFSFVACFIIGLRMFNRFRPLRKNGLSAKKRTLKCCCEVTWPRLRTYYVRMRIQVMITSSFHLWYLPDDRDLHGLKFCLSLALFATLHFPTKKTKAKKRHEVKMSSQKRAQIIMQNSALF